MTVPHIQTSAAAGEISPELYGEVDLKKFSVALTTARNAIVNYKGGSMSRAGFAFVGRCKQNPPHPPRPITFQFSNTQGYVLEFGDNYIRFVFQGGYVLEPAIAITGVFPSAPVQIFVAGTPFNNGDWVFISGVPGLPPYTYQVAGAAAGYFFIEDLNGNPIDGTGFPAYVSGGTASRLYTISTPYRAIDLPYLKFSQSADVMSLTCSNPITGNEYPPYDLTRFGNTNWTLVQTDFSAAIAAPASLSASPAQVALPPNSVPASYAWVVTAVDSKGNESIASPIATANGVDLQVEGGGYMLSWPFVPGAQFYNVYRSSPSIATYTVDGTTGKVTVSKWNPPPGGSIMGFVGSSYGTSFSDTNTNNDLQQTPPTHQEPFAPGQILAVQVTSQGSGLTAITYSITTTTGSGFAGYGILSNGQFGGFVVQNPGHLYQPSDTIAINGGGFASGSISFGVTNPSANDTITLNGVVWTFVATPSGAQQTQIGSTLAVTLQNLVGDLSASTNGALTVASYSMDVTQAYLLVNYKTAGAGGNGYTLAASRATPSGATLTGGSGTGFAGAMASGTLTFSGNPTNGQTIVLDGVTWTFVTSGAGPNQTNLQGSLATTLTQLASDLNASPNANIILASYSATATALNVVYKTAGTAGNSYTLGAGTAGATLSASTLTGGLAPSATPQATLIVGPESGTYPGVNTYFQQRHFFANSLNNPDTFWASRTGLFKNFDTQVPTIPTDAITASPWTEQVDGIQWLVPMPGGLLALTGSRAWQILGAGSYQLNAAALTPSSVEAQPQAFTGCSPVVPPIVIDHEVLYVEALQSIVRDLSWNFWVNIYTGADLTLLSSHLFLYRKILQWAWARNPYKIVWHVCDDGVMLALTFLKEQEVFAWTRHDTNGLVVGVTSVTEPPVNAVYIIVQRFPPSLVTQGGGGPTSFTMQARENYDPANVSLFGTSSPQNATAVDPMMPAAGYDAGRRQIMYLGMVTPGVNSANSLFTNSTGFTLFDGTKTIIANGASANINFNFSPQVMQKSIDTDAVVAYQTYSSSATVPANVGCIWPFVSAAGVNYTHITITPSGGGGTGMQLVGILDPTSGALLDVHVTNWGTGYVSAPSFSVSGDGTGAAVSSSSFITPSDGTYRWIGRDFSFSPANDPNGPNLVNPRNNDFWAHAQSCEVYQYRYADNFAQIIGEYTFASVNNPTATPFVVVTGIDATWAYGLTVEGTGPVNPWALCLIPAAIQSQETTTATKLAYVIWNAAPFSSDYGVKLTFGTDSHVYLFSIYGPGSATLFRVTRFTPPSIGTYGSNAAGSMADVTPWTAGVGPEADGANYTADGHYARAPYYIVPLRLPATNQVALIEKFPQLLYNSGSGYQFTKYSCTLITLGASPTYVHASGFVTGYMDSTWKSSATIPTTGWAVLDFRETNNWMEQSDYVYPGVDYTKRWLVFQAFPIVAGVVQTANGPQAVLTEYDFSVSPPKLVTVSAVPQVWADPNWDVLYTAYQTAISQSYVVYNSMILGYVPDSGSNFYNSGIYQLDTGLYDPTTQSFWFSGMTELVTTPNAAGFNNMFYLNPTFTPRATFNGTGTPQNALGGVTPPFLRLTIGQPAPPPPINPGAYMMERMDNRLWPSTEDVYAVDSGVSNPLTSPAANIYASSVSGAVTFNADEAVFSASAVNQILRMAGGIAHIGAFINSTQVTGTWILNANPGVIVGTPYAANGDWTLGTPITTLYAPHMTGATLVGLADGVPIGPLVPTGQFGAMTLPFAASNVKVGLSYTTQIQSVYANGPEIIQGARKIIPAVTVRFAASAKCLTATNQPDGGAQNPQVLAPPWTNLTVMDPLKPTGNQKPPMTYLNPAGQSVTALWTGDLRVVGEGDAWSNKGQVAIQQTSPLPIEVTAMMPELLDGDLPERGYSQGGGEGGGQPQQQPRGGPSVAMLKGPRI